MRNGFINLKELLHNQNLIMHQDHHILIHSNINVCSVKTDAFTSDADKLELAKPLLKFDNNFGSWRLYNTKYMSYPKVKLMQIISLKATCINMKL